MEAADRRVNLPGHGIVPGSHPIVLIGPNGSGKSRLASGLARKGGQRIAAQRLIQIEQRIGMRTSSEASEQLKNQWHTQNKEPWRAANELESALARVIAENSRLATDYMDRARDAAERIEPPTTDLRKLVSLWSSLFPGRTLNLADYQPTVEATGGKYLAQYMSDGERVSLYLALRVLLAEPGVLFVDEPEIHLHERLARRLWSLLEATRPDLRFVYITHSLSFALSRTNAQFGIVRSESDVKVLDRDGAIPSDVFEEIVGAATFSRGAKRFVFCEGEGFDEELYAAWYAKDAETAVISVGGCEQVKKCIEVFRAHNVPITGAKAIGIVDRDYWPEDYLISLPVHDVYPLPFHELESLLCSREIFEALAKRNATLTGDGTKEHEHFAEMIRRKFSEGAARNQVVLMRGKERMRAGFTSVLGSLKTRPDADVVRASFVAAMTPSNWTAPPDKVFDEEMAVVDEALRGPVETMLRVLPGKNYFADRAKQAGFDNPTVYKRLVVAALLAPDADEEMRGLKAALTSALERVLPPFPV